MKKQNLFLIIDYFIPDATSCNRTVAGINCRDRYNLVVTFPPLYFTAIFEVFKNVFNSLK